MKYMKIFIMALVSFVLTWTGAWAADYVEGRQYVEVPFGSTPDTDDKVEVREFFWYGCPHCYTLEPTIDHWLENKPADAVFVRTPALLPTHMMHAKTFYALQALGVGERLHSEIFKAIHAQQRNLSDIGSMADFVAEHGVDREKFLQAYNSFSVEMNVNQAMQLAQRYGINSVPLIVVDGRYLTGARYAGGNAAMFDVVDFLVKKAARERRAGR